MPTNLDDRPPTPFPNFDEPLDIENRNRLTTIEEVNEVPELANNDTVPSNIITTEITAEIKVNIKSKLFINTYIVLKSKTKDININATTIIHILKLSMELVEQLEDVKGTEQRDFAVLLVREIIDKSKMSQTQKENCLLVIDFGVLDNVVDFVIDATKGNVGINKIKKKVSRLFSCCK
jgi:hypothetical protein